MRSTALPLLNKVLGASINKYFDITPLTLLEKRFNDDMYFLQHTFWSFNWMMDTFLGLAVSLAIAMYAMPPIIIFVAAVAYSTYCLNKRKQHTDKKLKGLHEKLYVPRHTKFGEAVTGSTIIRSFDKCDEYHAKMFDIIDSGETFHLINRGIWSYFQLRSKVLGTGIQTMCYVLAFVYAGSTSSISLYFATRYANDIFECLSRLFETFQVNWDFMRKVQNVFELEDVPLEKKVDTTAADYKPLNITEGKLSVKNIYMRYREDRELVLKNLNFEVAAGEKVGVVGRTGAGKSSMGNAITRIVELESGCVEIDGQNVADYDLDEVRAAITVIP